MAFYHQCANATVSTFTTVSFIESTKPVLVNGEQPIRAAITSSSNQMKAYMSIVVALCTLTISTINIL